MKKGDIVYIKWNGREDFKDGPYTLTFYDGKNAAAVKETSAVVPCDWCEPAEPEIEEGRLCKYKEIITGITFYSEYSKKDSELFIVEPVHRRWGELGSRDKRIFTSNLTTYSGEDVFKDAYFLITGEEHP